jgi:hypothetical protein
MIRANDGASMKCTNCVSSRVCKHVAVLFDGSCNASNRTGTIATKHKHTELPSDISTKVVIHNYTSILLLGYNTTPTTEGLYCTLCTYMWAIKELFFPIK